MLKNCEIPSCVECILNIPQYNTIRARDVP